MSTEINQSKPGNRLFHYCKLKTAIEHILPTKQLLLSPLQNTNDPRENQSFVFGALTEARVELDCILKTNEDVSAKLRENVKLICFSDDYRPVYFGYELSSMWAHYGDNHQGVCIELDREKFLKENEGFIFRENLKKIEYLDFEYNAETIIVDHIRLNQPDSTRTDEYLNEFRHEHMDYLYFKKYREWEHEEEIRLIHFSQQDGDEFCSIKESLVNIFVGINFNENYSPAITQFADGVPVKKLVYQNGRLNPKNNI